MNDDEIEIAELDFENKVFASLFANFTAVEQKVVVPIYWHVISQDDSLEGGNIPDWQIVGSIDVLNQDYAGTGLQFELIDTDRVVNANWFNTVAPEEPSQTDMKYSLRKGNALTLNIYTVGFSSEDLLGYATFPSSYNQNPGDDGVVILYSTVPNGSLQPYNLGRVSDQWPSHQ